jgi:ribosomal protein S18 acetylase RimI-like enzyme
VSEPRIRLAEPVDHPALIDVWLRAEEARGVHRPPEVVDFVRGRLAGPGALPLIAETVVETDSETVVETDAETVAETDAETDSGPGERGAIAIGLALGEPARVDGGRGASIPGLAHVGMVFIRPDHWGRGIGGALVDELIARLRAAGYRQAELWVRVTNDRAQRLYTARGFRPDGAERDDGAGATIIRMVTDL